MIVDSVSNIYNYAGLHPQFEEIFNFLKINDLKHLPVGKYEIIKNKAFLISDKGAAKSKEQACLESHKKYIDIQLILEGTDEMGWSPLDLCATPIDNYNVENDIQFFKDQPQFFIPVSSGYFAMFFPEDAHMPMTGSGFIHKVVVKILSENY